MTDIVLAQIGIGLIGRTVIEQITAQRAAWERDYGLRVIVRALIDSTGGVACDEAGGYSTENLAAFLRHRGSGGRIANLPDSFGWTRRTAAEALTLTQPFGPVIAIDTAAGSKTAELLGMNLTNGGGAVLSNKAPLALPASDPVAELLWSESGFRGRLRYETTCGAGLPVISTLRSLIASGDEVTQVVGALSGTLGAIFADLDAGKPFSQAVADARAAGFTEPDPRDDLSGLDVARKALILARTIGIPVELDQIEIESLVPESLRDGSIDDFMAGISLVDAQIARRAEAARANGARLKYVATVAAGQPISVGMREIPLDTVLGSLTGPENIITIASKRYAANPINITGPGAGADVTAAGVVADMLELATTLGE
jgi:homoserine dehydrogenase